MRFPTGSKAGIYGYTIDSELPLTRLRDGGSRGRIVIERAAGDLLDEPAEILQVVDDPARDRFAFAVARDPVALFAWCAETGSYRIDAAGCRIWAEAVGVAEDWEDRVLNAVVPLLLLERGELLLHAAAVLTDAGALVVCGPCGRGKSTLAAVLGAHGLPVLGEDTVALSIGIEGALLWPGPVGVRLDAATAARLGAPSEVAAAVRGKQMHVPRSREQNCDPVPVAAVVALEPRDRTRLSVVPVSGPDAMANVFPSVLRLERETWPAAFARAAELVRGVRCYTASLPDDLRRLPAAALDLLAELRPGVPRQQAA